MNIIRYWLVDHPTISNFEWKRGTTLGSTPQFVALTIVSYLSLIFILQKCDSPPPSPVARRRQLLRLFAVAHNLILLLLSAVMAVGGSTAALSRLPTPKWLFCFPPSSINTVATSKKLGPVFFWAYVFYLSKILEFFDTALIILLGGSTYKANKLVKAKGVALLNNNSRTTSSSSSSSSSSTTKSRRLSFLHVYHHSVVVVMCYLWLDNAQSGLPLGVVTNATVHTVMYAYYMACAAGIRPSWKRAVTECQIAQFLIAGFVYGLVGLYYHFFASEDGCSGFRSFCFSAAFTASILYLFLDFHSKNYTTTTNKLLKTN